MCNIMLQITPDYHNRAIYRCEHGTFHLAWEGATFHLTPEALTLLHALAHGLETNVNACADCHIHLHRRISPAGPVFMEIWLSGFGLRLTMSDFEALQALLQDALDWLRCQPPFSLELHLRQAQAFVNLAQHIPSQRFSWN